MSNEFLVLCDNHKIEELETLLQQDDQIRHAYKLKERLRHWYQHRDLEKAATEFPNLIQAMMSSEIPEYKNQASETHRVWNPIVSGA